LTVPPVRYVTDTPAKGVFPRYASIAGADVKLSDWEDGFGVGMPLWNGRCSLTADILKSEWWREETEERS
jgi:hypothetical protein